MIPIEHLCVPEQIQIAVPDDLHAKLAKLCRSKRHRKTEFSREHPVRWHPTSVREPGSTSPFTEDGTSEFIAYHIENEPKYKPLNKPPGKFGYVMLMDGNYNEKIYIKLEIVGEMGYGRSFHASGELGMADMTQTHNPETCALCGSIAATTMMADHEYDYRHGSKLDTQTVSVPVTECSACDKTYFGEGAEELKHEAVCNNLGRLAPREIIELRQRLNMSQAQLAAITGIGVASIKRWETGLIIQNTALDRQLRNLEPTIKGEIQSP